MFIGGPGSLLKSGAVAKRVAVTPGLKEKEWNTLLELDGPGMISHIWFTFPWGDKKLGRRNLLRFWWDGEPEPSVVAPLTDFFGVPFDYTGNEFHYSCHYLAVAPRNAFNCYFPMPYGRKAKIEIFPEQLQGGGGFYFQADYYDYPKGLPEDYKDYRFHAQFRMENPCENYGRNYLFVDATGEGQLVGATFGIQMNDNQPDWWCHGGGDSIFVDGEKNPSVLHGIGAEDFFGHSWGVKHYVSPYIGTPHVEFDEFTRRLVLYRFFVADPIPFRKSIRGVLGALANNYTSVAYWYQKEKHVPFFNVPEADKRMPDSKIKYGKYDIEPEDAPEWKLLAPFRITEEQPFEKMQKFERREKGDESFVVDMGGTAALPGGKKKKVKWTPQTARHNFIDFNYVARPATLCICIPSNVFGYAVRYIKSDEEKEMDLHVGFDDDIKIRLNKDVVLEKSHPAGFAEAKIRVKLKKGKNRILVKLSNKGNTTWKLWAFSLRLEEVRKRR